MNDRERRALERDPEAAAGALGQRLRAGEFEPKDLRLLAYLELEGARELLGQVDPARLPARGWPEELAELALLSLAPTPERFCLGDWPAELAVAARRCVIEAAERAECQATRADPDFPERVTESLFNEVIRESMFGHPDLRELAQVLVILGEARGWAARGARASLYLQMFSPLARLLGVERTEELVREVLLDSILGAERLD